MTEILPLPIYWFTGENPIGWDVATEPAAPCSGALELGIFVAGVLMGGGPRDIGWGSDSFGIIIASVLAQVYVGVGVGEEWIGG